MPAASPHPSAVSSHPHSSASLPSSYSLSQRSNSQSLLYSTHTHTHHHTYHLIITLEQFVSLLLEGGEPAIIVLESLLFLQAAVVLDVTARVLLQPVLLLVLVHRRLAEGYVHARGRLA